MPYGLKNETPEQTKWIEDCVDSIKGTNDRTSKPYTKGEKIAICKVQLKKKGSSESYSEESLREQFYEFEDKIQKALGLPNIIEQPAYPSRAWVVDVFDDYVIIEKNSTMFKVPYSISGNDVTFDWSESIEVERKTVYETVESAKETKVPQIRIRENRRVGYNGIVS